MKNKQKIIFILSLVIFPPILIVLSHKFFPNNYLFSSAYKLIFFAPIFFGVYVKKESLKFSALNHFSLEKFKKNFLKLFFAGLLLSLIYLSSFFIFKNYIDTKSITDKINNIAAINLNNIILIGLFIIILNSILEEFFWRSFVFQELSNLIKPSLAYLVSAVAFSFHHVVFFYNWFSLTFFIIITIGLIGYALIMNFIWERYKELFSCWLPHAMVDVVQIFIAYQIFSSN